MPKVLLGVGSNLGDREAILNNAVDRFRELFDVLAVSSWFTYPAVGGPDEQGDFLNGALVAETSRSPQEVHRALQTIEQDAGRERLVRWSSRTLDCDLLLYGDEEIWTDQLKVPHPRMITRKFVLEPANDIACDTLHPTFGKTIGELLLHLQSSPSYFCILGSDRMAAREVAFKVSEKTDCLLMDQHDPFAGLSIQEALEWSQAAIEKSCVWLEETMEAGRACVGCSWVWEPWLMPQARPWSGLKEAAIASPMLDPKLLIVVDEKNSDFGELLGERAKQLKLPTLFLSENPEEALQDAVGAVLGMTM